MKKKPPTPAETINAASAALDTYTDRVGRTGNNLSDVPEMIVALRRLAVHRGIDWAEVVDVANLQFEQGL